MEWGISLLNVTLWRCAGEQYSTTGSILCSYFSRWMRSATINLSFQVLWSICPCFIFNSLWRASNFVFCMEREKGVWDSVPVFKSYCQFWLSGHFRWILLLFCCPHPSGRKEGNDHDQFPRLVYRFLQRTQLRQLTCVTHRGELHDLRRRETPA